MSTPVVKPGFMRYKRIEHILMKDKVLSTKLSPPSEAVMFR